MKSKIGCIVPVYQHYDSVLKLIPGIQEFISAENIVIVDDGSEKFDETEIVNLFPGLTILQHKENLGKGASLKNGMRYLAKNNYEYAMCIDGDGQHSPKDIPYFLDIAGIADIIIGDRHKHFGSMPLDRIFSNRVTTWIIRTISGLGVRDSQNGFRMINIKTIIGLNIKENGFQFESEMLIKAGKNNLSLVNVPVRTIYNKSGSSIHRIGDTWKFLKMILRNMNK